MLSAPKAITSRVWTRVANLVRKMASALGGLVAQLRRGPLYPVLVALAGITSAAVAVQAEKSATHDALFTVCMASVLTFSLLDFSPTLPPIPKTVKGRCRDDRLHLASLPEMSFQAPWGPNKPQPKPPKQEAQELSPSCLWQSVAGDRSCSEPSARAVFRTGRSF